MNDKLRIFRKNSDAILPTRRSAGALGWDLHTTHPFIVKPGAIITAHTGLVIQPPAGLAVELRARSGLAARGITLVNGVGTVDPDYIGDADEIKVILGNIGNDSTSFKVGDRIAQFVLVSAAPPPEIEEVSKAPGLTSRGGLGSTGVAADMAADVPPWLAEMPVPGAPEVDLRALSPMVALKIYGWPSHQAGAVFCAHDMARRIGTGETSYALNAHGLAALERWQAGRAMSTITSCQPLGVQPKLTELPAGMRRELRAANDTFNLHRERMPHMDPAKQLQLLRILNLLCEAVV